MDGDSKKSQNCENRNLFAAKRPQRSFWAYDEPYYDEAHAKSCDRERGRRENAQRNL